uniref:Uncharacterized protein n=1 Tax=Anguilla anguilla TaxID=7936 RepID=A0A0E9W551_ANGAN
MSYSRQLLASTLMSYSRHQWLVL